MSDEQINELLRLTKENNEMLAKIISHIEKITDDDYLAKHLLQEFINNVVADLFADMLLQPKGRGHINSEEIKDIKDLKTEIKRTEKYLITKACNLRAINILCNNVEKNYEITSDILKYRIIDLEDMLLEAQKNNDKFILKVYDDNAIAGILQYETNEDFNIKLNKKTKLFI
mgnify:CR=1 FL=1